MSNPLKDRIEEARSENLMNETDPDDQGGGPVVPAGWYKAEIEGASIDEVEKYEGSDVDASRFNLDYTITAPTSVGEVVSDGMNIENPSEKAENIAKESLTLLALAIGWDDYKADPGAYSGEELAIRVGIDEYDGNLYNEVTGFKDPADLKDDQLGKFDEQPELETGSSSDYDDEDVPF